MTIDIHPDDLFTINGDGDLAHHRGNLVRFIGTQRICEWAEAKPHNRKMVKNEVAIAWIRDGLGHTITEAQPAPTPVPWPTHAVVRKDTGKCIGFRGTEEECKHEVDACWGNHYEVRPLAPAPLSDKMKEFIEAFESYVDHAMPHSDEPKTYQHALLKALRALLAEGGAA